MTAIQVIQPKEVNGIEFYVSQAGDASGMSISGLARLCGVSRQTISSLLASLDGATKTVPKALEGLRGKAFLAQFRGVAIGGFDQAKIVTSEACAVIIEYYAYESKAKSELATIAFRQFAKIGVDAWIKQVTEYQPPLAIAHNDGIAEALKLLTAEVSKLSVKVEKLDNFQRTTVTNLPGLNQMFDSYSQDTLAIDSSTFTLKEWLANKGLTLDHAAMCSLGRLVADAYKFNRQTEVIRESQWKRDRSGKGLVTVYRASDEPILEVALNKFLK